LETALGAGVSAAASTALEALVFWADVLWIIGLWANADLRYQPFALWGSIIYVLGCTGCATLSLRLVFPRCFGADESHLDWKVAERSAAMWSFILLASWGACPSLLKLLPWSKREHGGLPTSDALWASFVLRVGMQSALLILKAVERHHLSVAGQPVWFTSVLNAALFARVLLERAFSFFADRAARNRWKHIRVFLSYRVDSDQQLVSEIYKQLRALGIHVWWDQSGDHGHGLHPGQPWEEGFANALLAAEIFVPVLSKDGLARFGTLTRDSPADNVLLEFLLALEQKERGAMKAIFPVFVGKTSTTTSSDGQSLHVHGNFFRGGGMPSSTSTSVTAVDTQAQEHLVRHAAAVKERDPCGACAPLDPADGQLHTTELLVHDRSPSAVLDQIKRYQGGFIEGERSKAIAKVADSLLKTVHDVAAVQPLTVNEIESVNGEPESSSAEVVESSRLSELSRLRGVSGGSWAKQLIAGSRNIWRGSGRSSDRSQSIESPVVPHKAPRDPVEDFFTPSFASDEETSNPVLIHTATQQNALRRAGGSGSPARGGSAKAGAWRRLLPEKVLTPDEEVAAYLQSQEVSVAPTQGDTSLAAMQLQQDQLSRWLAEKKESTMRKAKRGQRRTFGVSWSAAALGWSEVSDGASSSVPAGKKTSQAALNMRPRETNQKTASL